MFLHIKNMVDGGAWMGMMPPRLDIGRIEMDITVRPCGGTAHHERLGASG